MKTKRGLICLMMTLLITAGFIFGIKADTSAASEFPNLTLSNGVLSWDKIKAADTYYLYAEGGNGAYLTIDGSNTFGGCCQYLTDGISFNLQKYFDKDGYFEDGEQKIELYALRNNEYLDYKSTVTFNYVSPLPKLATPDNLKWDGKIISWDAVTGAKVYYAFVYVVRDGASKLVWCETTDQTSLDTGKDSAYSSSHKAVQYDEDYTYYFTVQARDYSVNRVYKDSDIAISNTISGSTFIKDKGTTGGCEWLYNADKQRLIISGTGSMANYSATDPAPWSKFGTDIVTIVIKDGVTEIGSYAFAGLGIDSITIPDSVEAIYMGAFYNCYSLYSVNLGSGLWGIDEDAFVCDGNGTAKMKKITIPANVDFISDKCVGFIKNSDSTYTAIADFEITGACGSEANFYANYNNISWKSTGHAWDNGVVTKEATCMEDGIKTFTCQGCDLTKTEPIENGTHTLTRVDAKDAIVTAEGNIEYYTCSVCKKWFSDPDGTIEITDHSSVIIPKLDAPTATPTSAPTATATVAPTATATPVATATATPVATETPAVTATATPAVTVSATPTATAAPTPGSDIAAPSPADDGNTLKDPDGTTYLIADKMTADQLAKNVSVADKTTGGKYKITSLTKKGKKIKGGTVSFLKPYDSKASAVKIADTVKIAGVKFKVTEIAKNACKGNSSIKRVTIGKNVAKIGANAFNKCVNLNDIKIKTTKLSKKTVGKNAFKGINKKAVAKVPSGKRKVYRTILKAKGMKLKTQKIK